MAAYLLAGESLGRLLVDMGAHFPCVHVWAGTLEDVAGSLARPFSPAELDAAPHLFAVASAEPIDAAALLARLSMTPLEATDVAGLRLELIRCPERASAREQFEACVRLCNDGPCFMSSRLPNRFT
jgi:hypothetical protein